MPCAKTPIDIRHIESGQIKIEVEIGQVLQFDGEDLTIPVGLFGQAIVGNDVRTLLVAGRVFDQNRRDRSQAYGFCGRNKPVLSDDLFVLINQHRIEKAEAID